MPINIILATTNDGLIGSNNGLPWNIPGELKYFKAVTSGSIVVMGSNTFKSIGKKLPDRVNVVMSSDVRYFEDKADYVFTDIENIIELGNTLKKDIFIIGGKQVYEQWMDKADKLYLSLIPGEYKGDIYLPIDFSKWKKTKLENHGVFSAFEFVKH